MSNQLTHVNTDNQPGMVSVGDKSVTHRTASAQAIVHLPENLASLLHDGEINSPKGPVLHTAIIAGTMAVKRTHELIPFCHPLTTERCSFDFNTDDPSRIIIHCQVGLHAKTGVEMEALTGVSVAALTIYDMCKSVSHDIVISDIRLLKKTGGKSDIDATH